MNERMQFIAQSIAKAKQVMDKVEKGNYSRGNVSRDLVIVEGADLLETLPPGTVAPPQPQRVPQLPATNHVPAGGQRMGSKMPSSILESFQKSPGLGVVNTSNPLAMNGFQMDALANETKKMSQPQQVRQPQTSLEQQAMIAEQINQQQQAAYERQMREMEAVNAPSFSQQLYGQPAAAQPQFAQPQYAQPAAPQLSEDYIKYIISETVKATVKAVMEDIYKPQSLDENIQLIIGGKRFGGKIKTLKEQTVKG